MTDHRNSTQEPKRGARVHRRDCLRALAAGLVAARVPGLQAASLRDVAKKNIRLGIDGNVYSRFTVDEAASRIHDAGFSSVLCSYYFADARLDPLSNDWEPAKKIAAAFAKKEINIKIAAAFGYANLVDPNKARLEREKARMHALLANWKRLGCNNISTETGTFNESSPWADAPQNFTEEGYVAARNALAELAKVAEKFGAVVSIEAYWRNCIDSIERAERLFKEVDSPALKLVMDPCNYFRKEALPKMKPMLEDMFKRLGTKIVVAHAKDVKAASSGTDLPAAGLGVLDYPLFLRLLAQLDRPMDLLLEHLTLEDMPRAKAFVLAQMEKV